MICDGTMCFRFLSFQSFFGFLHPFQFIAFATATAAFAVGMFSLLSVRRAPSARGFILAVALGTVFSPKNTSFHVINRAVKPNSISAY